MTTDQPSLSDSEQQAADAQAISAFSAAVGNYMASQAKDMGLDFPTVIASIQQAADAEEISLPSEQEMGALKAAFDAVKNRPIEALSQAIIAETDIASPGSDWKASQGLPAGEHDEFMQEFISQDGVKVTDSGLAYSVLKTANGDKPTASDTVTVHYVGRHTSGEIFDSSISRGEPTSFPLSGVIAGWTEGLQLVSVGETVRLVIPGELAYGPLQAGSQRPTGTLLFDVTLLRIGG